MIELERSASDANVSILSRGRQQPIIAKRPAGHGFLNTSDVATHIVHFCWSVVGLYERNKQNQHLKYLQSAQANQMRLY